MSFLSARGAARLALALSLALIPTACGGGGGGGGGGGSAGASGPIQVVFPRPGSTTSEPTTTVRGNTEFDDVTGVTVNGVNAASSDQFATWSAIVPLDPGSNSFDIQVFRQGGVVTSRQSLGGVDRIVSALTDIRGIERHPTQPILAVADVDSGRVLEINLDTGEQTVITESTVTQFPVGLAYDDTGTRLYISDTELEAIFEFDRSTGFLRTVTSNTSFTSNPRLGGARDLLVDDARSRLIVSDLDRDAILAVSLSTGARTYISGSGVRGSGPSLSSPRGIDWLDANNILVANRAGGSSGIYRVDLTDGDRFRVTTRSTGSGVALENPVDVVTTNGGVTGVYLDDSLDQLVEFNVLSGARTLLTGENRGTGQPVDVFSSDDLELDRSTGELLFSNEAFDSVVSVFPATGDRSIFYRADIGTGPVFQYPEFSVLDAQRDRILVSDQRASSIFAVSTANGARTIFSDAGANSSGSPFEFPRRIAIDPTRDQLIAEYRTGILYWLPLTGPSQDPVPFSFNDGSSGPTFTADLGDMVVSPDGTTLWVVDQSTLFEVDLATGMRTQRGPSNQYTTTSGLAINFELNLAYVLDRGRNAIDLYNIAAPGTLNPTRVADNNGNGSGTSIDNGIDLAMQPDGSSLWLLNNNRIRLVDIDLNTGFRTIVSGLDPDNGNAILGSGPSFQGVGGLSQDEDGSVIIQDLSLQSVLRVDPVTGARVFLSH